MSDTPGSRFRASHATFFVLPNPWDQGSALTLQGLGFVALATTSSGFAMSLGREDGDASKDELIDHVASLAAVVDIPINVDAERCFADDPSGVADTIGKLAAAGAGGVSIEDWDPAAGAIDTIDVATARVAASVEAGRRHDLVITARCENHIRGVQDLDDTIVRLAAYRDAGADVLYAPGIKSPEDITRVVELGLAVNVLNMPGVPAPAELADLGVIRLSTGGALARIAYKAMEAAAKSLLSGGAS